MTHARDHADFPLRRFVRCGECGRPLTGAWLPGRSARYAYYECPGCREVRVAKPKLEGGFVTLLGKLQPQPKYMRLFNETVLEASRQRHASARESRTRLQAEVAKLRQQLDDLDAAFLFRHVVDQRTYERQRDLLRESVLVAELRLEDAADEGLDVEGILEFAHKVLTNAARLWEQATPANKQRLQQVFFPEGVECTAAGGTRTVVTCLAFTGVQPPARGEIGLASPAIENSNRMMAWLRGMSVLRQLIGTAA